MSKPGKVIEYIFPVNEEAKNLDEIFIGVIRSHPQLIRCKDCKYYQKIGESGYCAHRRGLNGKPCADDYCSWAERKEE